MRTVIRVGILDGNFSTLSFYQSYLSSQIDIDVVFACRSIVELEVNQPSVIIPDLILADMATGGLSQLLHRFPNCKIVMLSDSEESDDVVNALKMGAVGYITKSADLSFLYGAIKSTMKNGSFISPKAAWNLVQELQKKPEDALEGILSTREKEVLDYLKNGLSYKEIAAQMFISVHAVNQHLKKIYKKLQVKSKGELLAKYFQHQLGGQLTQL